MTDRISIVSMVLFLVLNLLFTSSDITQNFVFGEEPEKVLSQNVLSENGYDLHRLLEVLEKHTEIATKTKLNADYVPGMVTVLDSEELITLGVKTVWEALAMVPGLNIYVQSQGIKRVLVRGAGITFASGNLKLLVNNIPVNSAFVAMESPALELPMEIIDRIEVIRGPGSAIHGEFAYGGVINVITRKNVNSLYGHSGSNDTYAGGAIASLNSPENKFNLSLALSGMDTDGNDSRTGPDALYGTPNENISLSPGKTNEKREAESAFLTLDYRNFFLVAQHLETGHGDYMGVSNELPQSGDRQVVNVQNDMIMASLKFDLSSSLSNTCRLAWIEHEYKVDRYNLHVPGWINMVPPVPVLYADGMIASPYYQERKIEGNVDFQWKGLDRHVLLAGWSFAKTEIIDAWLKANYNPSSGNPLLSIQKFDGIKNWLQENNDRFQTSLTFQDEFRINKYVTLTTGLRYDHYDDVGGSVNPRLAAVWRMNGGHNLKVQYSRAFRPPTFLEMYTMNNPLFIGNPDIDPEIIDSYEAGYIYKQDQAAFRITFFYSSLRDLIVLDQSRRYSNSGGARLSGAELELIRELGNCFKLNTNFSILHTKDRNTGAELEGSANFMANSGLTWQAWKDVFFSLQYRYVGDRNRAPQDIRSDLDRYQTLDLTGNLFNAVTRGMTLRAGVKNLFNDDVRYPAPPNTYRDDYPGPDREWWISLSCKF